MLDARMEIHKSPSMLHANVFVQALLEEQATVLVWASSPGPLEFALFPRLSAPAGMMPVVSYQTHESPEGTRLI